MIRLSYAVKVKDVHLLHEAPYLWSGVSKRKIILCGLVNQESPLKVGPPGASPEGRDPKHRDISC